MDVCVKFVPPLGLSFLVATSLCTFSMVTCYTRFNTSRNKENVFFCFISIRNKSPIYGIYPQLYHEYDSVYVYRCRFVLLSHCDKQWFKFLLSETRITVILFKRDWGRLDYYVVQDDLTIFITIYNVIYKNRETVSLLYYWLIKNKRVKYSEILVIFFMMNWMSMIVLQFFSCLVFCSAFCGFDSHMSLGVIFIFFEV